MTALNVITQGFVVLAPHAVSDLRRLAESGIKYLSSQNGLSLPRWEALVGELRAAEGQLVSAGGYPATTSATKEESWGHHMITIKEGAAMLGISDRQMRNLATRFGGQKDGRDWRLNRDLVVAEAARRKEDQ